MESYIEDKKKLYSFIYEFIDNSEEICDEHNDNFLTNLVNNQQMKGDREEMIQFLEIIKSIADNHHRDQQFNEKINHLLLLCKTQIKHALSNFEIFNIFESNKKIVLFLLKKDIIKFSKKIYNEMIYKIESNGNFYCHFFIPEIENLMGEEKIKFVKNELLEKDSNFFDKYEEKRQEGENDSYICSLIRQDHVVEFISYVNRYNISYSSQIPLSIFETNSFLIENKKTTLIEYAAFFGSIQIFQYLLNNKVELTPSLWIYAIHSKNAEMIHLLESNEISPQRYENFNYVQCFIESIKCHHNNIADYIESNLMDQIEKNSKQEEEIISNYIKYHNYSYFQIDSIIDHGFFYLKFYHYDKLFELLYKKKEKEIEMKSQKESNKNDVEVVYYSLLNMNKISEKRIFSTEMKQMVIPSSVTEIGNYALRGCSTLAQVAIPSSVTSIGKYVFYGYSSLTQISIPSSVTSIGYFTFSGCSSLKYVSIPTSVTSIGDCAFLGCSSLEQISIPYSVTSIGNYAFEDCSLLEQIVIPSSVTEISNSLFYKCSSLKQITFVPPSTVTIIGDSAFYGCSLLTKISIPSSVTEIGESSFRECSSLIQISIPSSITLIGSAAFYKCSSLMQITFSIPSSVTSFEDCAFFGCSSLVQITIPSSVTSIGYATFEKCTSLTQISIPSSVTSIGSSAFYECSSLSQITIPSSVTEIGDYAFFRCSSLTQISIPSSMTKIQNSTFYECTSLAQISIPSSVIIIGKSAFFGCSSLRYIAIPSSVTSIGQNCFSECSSLEQISIPSSLEIEKIGLNSQVQILYNKSLNNMDS